MPALDAALSDWVCHAVGGATVREVRSLGDGGPPWMLRLDRDGGESAVVLRIGDPADSLPVRTEAVALRLAENAGVAVPRLIAVDADHVPPLLLSEAVAGASAIPRVRPAARLRSLGALAATLHGVVVPTDADLPHRTRPIPSVDFAALRSRQPAQPLLTRAEDAVRDRRPGSAEGLVHGDLWQGNVLWSGDALTAVVDWECAGVGPAGVDLGSLRCDAALCFGLAAAEDVLTGWQAAAGRPADDVAYWDVVAALSTPPDMQPFDQAIASQGRPDLTRETLRARRDEFLEAALDSLRT